MVGLMYLKELILIRQVHQKNVMLVTIGILKILVIDINHIFPVVVMI